MGQWKTIWVSSSMAGEAHKRQVRSWVGAWMAFGQIAFPFDAKVMATGSKASEGDTEIGVIDFKQVRCWLGEGQAAANVL